METNKNPKRLSRFEKRDIIKDSLPPVIYERTRGLYAIRTIDLAYEYFKKLHPTDLVGWRYSYTGRGSNSIAFTVYITLRKAYEISLIKKRKA